MSNNLNFWPLLLNNPIDLCALWIEHEDNKTKEILLHWCLGMGTIDMTLITQMVNEILLGVQ
jgi:hypothetical protein